MTDDTTNSAGEPLATETANQLGEEAKTVDDAAAVDAKSQNKKKDRFTRRQWGIFGVVLLQTSLNLTLFAVSTQIGIGFETAPWSVWIMGVLSYSIALFSFIGFFDGDIPAPWAWASILFNGLIVIGVFASVHKGLGLVYAGPLAMEVAAPLDWGTAIYFSIVTFTTLGYGDFQPVVGLRLIAATQALLGYLFLGLLVGAALQTVSQGTRSSERDQDENRT